MAVLRVAASKLPDGLRRAPAGREGVSAPRLAGAVVQSCLAAPGLAVSGPRGGREAGGRERR